MIGECLMSCLSVLPHRPAVTDCVIHLTSTATPKQTGAEHKETSQLELSSELKYTVYSLFI